MMLAVSKFQYVVHLCKLFECSTLIFKNCAVSEVAIEKYVGLLKYDIPIYLFGPNFCEVTTET